MNKADLNICIQVFVWTYVFISLGCIPRSWVAGSYSKCMFKFLRNCQVGFKAAAVHFTFLPSMY